VNTGSSENNVRAPEGSGTRTCLRHLQKVALNMAILADLLGHYSNPPSSLPNLLRELGLTSDKK
jgi:hypothetical protein